MSDLAKYLEELNEAYLKLHRTKEMSFWETRMGIRDRHEELVESDLALREWLADPAPLAQLRRLKDQGDATPEQMEILNGWILMFSRNQIEDAEARELQREIAAQEGELQQGRGKMKLGYTTADGEFTPASSVALGNAVRTNPDEAIRKAAFEGLRDIETFALENGWVDIVKKRNRFARMLGFEDFYDYKVQWAEGFDKKTLFGYLDELEDRTRSRAAEERNRLAAEHGESALKPWNFLFLSQGGSIQEELDPYFSFEDALERWVRSFGALGIRFRDAQLTLDLIDRKGKYENGFMHAPGPAFVRNGEWLPAEINFTANALPDQPGAGLRAAQTLFHEGGHAAHFANIVMGAPCFSQEFAPTSVALAETQSMFCDEFLSDADWRLRYGKNAAGEPLPFELIEREIRATHPFRAQGVRGMLTIVYAEREIYETPDAELTTERVLEILREVEDRIGGLDGGASRPTLSVPHLLSWDASAYYHGYVLARMAVYQTRAHFRRKYGFLLDNPAIGQDLAEIYWRPGNSKGFLDLVKEMTGRPFSADAQVEEVTCSTDEAVAQAKALADALPNVPEPTAAPDLDCRLRIIHGPETVVEGGRPPLEVAAEFKRWIRANWPSEPEAAAS